MSIKISIDNFLVDSLLNKTVKYKVKGGRKYYGGFVEDVYIDYTEYDTKLFLYIRFKEAKRYIELPLFTEFVVD